MGILHRDSCLPHLPSSFVTKHQASASYLCSLPCSPPIFPSPTDAQRKPSNSFFEAWHIGPFPLAPTVCWTCYLERPLSCPPLLPHLQPTFISFSSRWLGSQVSRLIGSEGPTGVWQNPHLNIWTGIFPLVRSTWRNLKTRLFLAFRHFKSLPEGSTGLFHLDPEEMAFFYLLGSRFSDGSSLPQLNTLKSQAWQGLGWYRQSPSIPAWRNRLFPSKNGTVFHTMFSRLLPLLSLRKKVDNLKQWERKFFSS